jgi:hypothetical protein
MILFGGQVMMAGPLLQYIAIRFHLLSTGDKRFTKDNA